jgi:hypothetical protein
MYAYPSPPPDLQVLKALEYLWERLRSDEELNKWFPSPDSILAGTICRPVVQSYDLEIDLPATGFPFLAMWRGPTDRNKRARVGFPGYECKAGIQWFTSVPSGEATGQGVTNLDGLQWGAGLAQLVHSRICYHLETNPDRNAYLYDAAYIDEIYPLSHSIVRNVEHTHPLYEVPEGVDLAETAITIKLHWPPGTEPGLEIGATF